MTDTEAAAATPAPETKPASTEDVKPTVKADQTDDAATSDPDDATVETSERKPRGGFQKRIGELVAHRNETARERDYWREIAMRAVPGQGEPQAQAQAVRSDGEPRIEDFSDYEEYLTAKAEHRIEQKLKAKEAKSREETVAQSRQKAYETFQSKVTEVSSRNPDIADSVERAFAGEIPISEAMAQSIVEFSDRGPELLHVLVNNPQEAQRIAGLNPVAAARAITLLEAKLASVEPKKVTAAPAPASKVSGASDAAKKNPQEMSMSEYAAWFKTRGKRS